MMDLHPQNVESQAESGGRGTKGGEGQRMASAVDGGGKTIPTTLSLSSGLPPSLNTYLDRLLPRAQTTSH